LRSSLQGYYGLGTQGGPACMLQANIDLVYQINLSDLKAIKKDTKQVTSRAGARSDGRSGSGAATLARFYLKSSQ